MAPSPLVLATAEELVAELRALRATGERWVLASDLDGTLAPIAHHRDDTRVDALGLRAFDALRRSPGIVPCIASGRPLTDLRRLMGDSRGWALIAEHGALCVDPDGALHREQGSVETQAALKDVEPLLQAFLARFPGSDVERKETSVAVHVRGVPSSLAAEAAEALLRLAAEVKTRGLQAIEGRAVLELRLPLSDKGKALARLRDRLAPGGALAFAGDDVTDEPGLRLAAAQGLAVFIVSDERPVPPAIEGLKVAEREQWVEALALFAGVRKT